MKKSARLIVTLFISIAFLQLSVQGLVNDPPIRWVASKMINISDDIQRNIDRDVEAAVQQFMKDHKLPRNAQPVIDFYLTTHGEVTEKYMGSTAKAFSLVIKENGIEKTIETINPPGEDHDGKAQIIVYYNDETNKTKTPVISETLKDLVTTKKQIPATSGKYRIKLLTTKSPFSDAMTTVLEVRAL